MADTPDFQFLRNTPVDLSRYLPTFLFRDTSFSDTLSTLSHEHEVQRLTLTDAAQQAFVKTATWGLDDWEEFVGLGHESADTLQTRRNKILMKLAGVDSVTVPFLTRMVNLYVADGQAAVVDYPDTYSMEVLYHGGQVLDYEKLRSAIGTYIPAHIGYKLVTITTADILYHGAGTVQAYGKCIVDMTTDYTNTISDSSRYIAGIVAQNYKQISIMGGNIKWLNFQL